MVVSFLQKANGKTYRWGMFDSHEAHSDGVRFARYLLRGMNPESRSAFIVVVSTEDGLAQYGLEEYIREFGGK